MFPPTLRTQISSSMDTLPCAVTSPGLKTIVIARMKNGTPTRVICLIMTLTTTVNIFTNWNLKNVPPCKRFFQVLAGGTIRDAALWMPQYPEQKVIRNVRSRTNPNRAPLSLFSTLVLVGSCSTGTAPTKELLPIAYSRSCNTENSSHRH